MEELAADAGRGGVAGEHQSQHVRRSRLVTPSCPRLVTQSCARLQSTSLYGPVANGNWLVGVGLMLSAAARTAPAVAAAAVATRAATNALFSHGLLSPRCPPRHRFHGLPAALRQGRPQK